MQTGWSADGTIMSQGAVYVSFDVGIKNLAFCVCRRDAVGGKLNVVCWRNVDIGVKKSDAAVTDALLNVLDAIAFGDEHFEGVSGSSDVHVLIERQPSKGRKLMSVIQSYIEAFFKTCSKYHGGLCVRVHVVSPKCKSSRFLPSGPSGPSVSVQTIAGGARGRARSAARNARYRNNKRASVEAITTMLRSGGVVAPPDVTELFLTPKRGLKLDDLADSLLQLVCFLDL